MKKSLAALLLLSLIVAACGDDDTGSDDPVDTILTAAEIEWCTLADTSDETAFRFDQIFEGGLARGLPMDALNAQASQLRTDYVAGGMTDAEAVVAVGRDLLAEPVFQEACQEAYGMFAGG